MKIKPIKRYRVIDEIKLPIEVCTDNAVRHLEADHQKAIDALKLMMDGVNGLPPLTAIQGVLTTEWNLCKNIVEKAYGMPWEEIEKGKG